MTTRTRARCAPWQLGLLLTLGSACNDEKTEPCDASSPEADSAAPEADGGTPDASGSRRTCDDPGRLAELDLVGALGALGNGACGDDRDCELVPLDTACSHACLPAAATHPEASALATKRDALEAALCFDPDGATCPAPALACAASAPLQAVCRDNTCVAAAPSVAARLVSVQTSDLDWFGGYYYDDPSGRRLPLVAPAGYPYVDVPFNADGHPELVLASEAALFSPEALTSATTMALSSIREPGGHYTVLFSVAARKPLLVFDEQRERESPPVEGHANLWLANAIRDTRGVVGAVGIAGSFCSALADLDPETPLRVTGLARGSKLAFYARKEGASCVGEITTTRIEAPPSSLPLALTIQPLVFEYAPASSNYLVVLDQEDSEPLDAEYTRLSATLYPLYP